MMLRKTFLTVSVGAMLAAVSLTPNGVFAFGPPPLGLGGPPPVGLAGPPHLGPGGPPHLGGHPPALGPRAPSAIGRGGPASLDRSGSAGVARSGSHAYGRNRGRDGRGARYGVAIYGEGGSYTASSNDNCHYSYTSSGRRVAVCDDN
jgi:hypothetical protein